MSNHLKTAHEYGVQKALENVGYKSAEEVRRDAEALGLIQPPQKTAESTLEGLFRTLQK
jgi:hypothetical protein